MDNLQHIDDLLRQASQVPANALVNASDWAVVEKRLKRRKNRIYTVWFFLALISVSSLGVLFHHENSNKPIEHIAKAPRSTADTHNNLLNSQDTQHVKIVESTHKNATELPYKSHLRPIAPETRVNHTQTVHIPAAPAHTRATNAVSTPTRSTEHVPYTPSKAFTLLSIRSQLPSPSTETVPPNTLHLIPLTKIVRTATAAKTIGTHENNLPDHETHWEIGISFTPSLSSKITSENARLNGLINRSYYDKVAKSETSAFSNTFGFNTQYHTQKWFVSSGLFMTQRTEQLDYNYQITEGPNYNATVIYGYVPLDPQSYESVVYSGANSYHFLEIPLNFGYKTSISPNFEIRTQLGASYMALLSREGKKGNFTTLELEDLKDLQFAQHNIAANIKTGVYLNKQRFVLGVEPLFGINLNSLRPAETSAIKTKPYGYGLNITSAIKLFKL